MPQEIVQKDTCAGGRTRGELKREGEDGIGVGSYQQARSQLQGTLENDQ